MERDPIVWQLLLQAVLIGLNAVFACAEIAVVSLNDVKLARLAAQGDRRAVRLAALTKQPARFLATIQVAITLSGFLGSAFAADSFSEKLSALALSWGVPLSQKALGTLSVVCITLILSYFTLVFGELVPKRLAMKNAEKLALGMAGMIAVIARLFAPLVSLLTASTNGILRLLGLDPNAEDAAVTEEDIRLMVDAGGDKGTIDRAEQRIIQNVFEFDDITAGELATHRTDIVLLWKHDGPAVWDETIRQNRYSRYPVCGESVDDVLGVLSAKDYFRLPERDPELVWHSAVKPAYFVPESVRADVLFHNMKATGNRFAIVLDEYGGMTGIVTISDLVEQLVGDISDDGPAPVPEIAPAGDGAWTVRGSAPIEDVAHALGVEIPEGEYDTFGGYVFSELGTVPEDGACPVLEANGLSIRVLSVREHRLEAAEVRPAAPAQ